MRPRVSIWLLIGGAGLFAVVLTSVLSVREDRQVLKVSDVEGTWSNLSGERLTVRADGSAGLERVTQPQAGCGQPGARTYTGPATWEFDGYPDEGPGIRFDFQGPDTGQSCRVYLAVSISENAAKGFLPHNAAAQYVRGRSS